MVEAKMTSCHTRKALKVGGWCGVLALGVPLLGWLLFPDETALMAAGNILGMMGAAIIFVLHYPPHGISRDVRLLFSAALVALVAAASPGAAVIMIETMLPDEAAAYIGSAVWPWMGVLMFVTLYAGWGHYASRWLRTVNIVCIALAIVYAIAIDISAQQMLVHLTPPF